MHTIMNPTSSTDGIAIPGIKYLRDVQNLKLRMHRRIIFVCPLPAPIGGNEIFDERKRQNNEVFQWSEKLGAPLTMYHPFVSELPSTSWTPTGTFLPKQL